MKRRYSLPLWICLSLLALLLLLHIALPYVIRDYLNDKLADMGDYRGQIEDVDLALWRGAYRINGLSIVKDEQTVPVPFVAAPRIDISVSWSDLWREQAVVARVVFDKPEVNFVDGEGSDDSQTGEGVDWREQLNKLLPITLNEVRVIDGTLGFYNFNASPPVKIQANAIEASLYNLTNVADEQGDRVARFEGTAQLLGHAPLEASAVFDPFHNFEDFEFRVRATDIQLTRLNDLANAYGKFDFKSGSGDLVVEASAEDAQLSGYIKPLLRNVEVFDWQQDVENQNKGFFRSIWEALVGGSEKLLKNQRQDQIATRVELSGSTRQQNISAFQAFIGILRNGFVEAFTPRYERPPPQQDGS
ncbi:DUF748 domain-containing protein [Pseudomonas berkeleyensis]|uniref:DUF748 domain-containing protein n=1 Tax=Pseudomonas berkeleyensis TaxID=2726956 RepID=A0A7G5DIA7_9PSED|nr:DUF748 domain-containing protein [Pseudomonas berkeleyensis]QMV61482.1 DUF748 domain-containing protein [Pseudomonas berkeleyensis]WSO36913.1 DUF748 domain-containing protein [Pseudomonas berkeleyensis]